MTRPVQGRPGHMDEGGVVPFISFPSWLAILPDPTLYLKPALSDFFTIDHFKPS